MSTSEEIAVVRVQFNDEWIVRFHVSTSLVPSPYVVFVTCLLNLHPLLRLSGAPARLHGVVAGVES